jgi:hypothetical protein
MLRFKPFRPWILAALLLQTLAIWLIPGIVQASAEIILDDYRTGLSPKWKEKSFQGHTLYRVTDEASIRCILAQSHNAASALYYEIIYNPKDHPILAWRWKIAGVLEKGDARTKAGDDYPARVYVVFPSVLFWRTKALNYIWANHLPKGQALPNAYTPNAIMIAVESGPKRQGQWVEERRDIFADFQKHFRAPPPDVGAIAIMTDTDNTGGEATAWYGSIRILSKEDP